jgi:tRNA U34 5-carboxymethylaminomethyl modifying enzyme MnmG/GidA
MHFQIKKKTGTYLAASVELRAVIEDAGRQIQREYRKTLEKVQKLKNQINKLEQHTPKTRLKALDLVIKRLNRLTDSQIMRSKKAWEEYRKLEQECKRCTACHVQLGELRTVCKKTEELAADLLCYSLARFKQSERQS